MIAALLAIAVVGAPSVFDATFQRGNSAYESEDYQTAIAAYEQLMAEGVEHESLFFNLGNAYFRAGNTGLAIVNYERALRINPAHTSARQNLDFAVAQTEHQWARPLPPAWEQSLLMWHYTWSPRAVHFMAVFSWVALWILLAARLWKPNAWLSRAAIVAGLAAAAFGASSYAKTFAPPLVVAIEDDVPVRFSIGESQTVNFELMRGDRLIIDQRANGWVQVRSADGQRGWTQERALAVVGPPYQRPPDRRQDARAELPAP
ncbi:MAG: tetratricopeptide repeat protein [Candidatus Hydrogenedentes bacterium]|nr:tetratricopeptide repeat protein [Candidatus Hydrogenedentota bacterium]